MKRIIGVTLLALWAGQGQAQSAYADVDDLCDFPIPPGAVKHAFEVTQRTQGVTVQRYVCAVEPAGVALAGTGPRAVIVLHGGNGDARKLSTQAKEILSEASDRGYVALFAQGWPRETCPGLPCDTNSWNGTADEGGTLVDLTAANDAYIRRIASGAQNRYGVAPEQIYLAGFSGGAQLIYQMLEANLAEGHNAFIPRAAATMAGVMFSLPVPEEDPSLVYGALPTALPDVVADARDAAQGEIINLAVGWPPTHIMLLQGDADDRVPVDGGLGKEDTVLRNAFQVKVDMARVMNRAFGGAIALITSIPGGGNLTSLAYPGDLAEVVSLRADTLGHTWPGWYSAIVFDFFEDHATP